MVAIYILYGLCNFLKLFAPWVMFSYFLSSADFFQNQLFRKILSGIPSECQAVWIQIWFQTVRKSYQPTTPVGKGLILAN